MKRVAWITFLFLAACSKNPDGDGFASLKYGMQLSELAALGFKCGPDEQLCDQTSPPPPAGRASLFDKPARLMVSTVAGHLSTIDVMVPNYDDDELIDMFRTEYGKPELCRFTNALAATVERAVWSASNGATVTVSKMLDHGVAPDLSGLSERVATATYRSPEASKSFKAHSC